MTIWGSIRHRLEDLIWTWRPLAVSAVVRRDIEELVKARPELEHRFALAPISLSWSWFPSTIQPSLEDELLGASQPSEVIDLSDEYEAEVQALDFLNTTSAEDIPLARWQRTKDANATEMYRSQNRRAHAQHCWNELAIPVRYKEGKVFRIFRPIENFRRPVILGLPAETFVAQATINSVWLAAEIEQKRRRISFLEGILLILTLLLLWRW